MADLGPRDRLDIPIWNAIDAHNFKQALKYVDKRLAKKPSEYLDVSSGSFQVLVWDKSIPKIHVT